MKPLAISCIVMGGLITVFMYLGLRKSGAAAYHQNPFALHQSGYGTVLARLGQTNLDRAWHYGAVAGELSKKGGEDEHAGHNHAEGEGHGQKNAKNEGGSILEPILNHLVDLDAERFRRTSWVPMSKADEKRVARDIEKMLVRGYNMDPVDYGAYDAYYHFLMYHRLRGTLEDAKSAAQMCEYTISVAFQEKMDPMPWLTASVATLNQFFLHQRRQQQEAGDPKITLPDEILVKYRDQINYTLSQYFKLRKEANEAGRWDYISEERKDEADERARLASKMSEQFSKMLKREDKVKSKKQPEK